MVQERLRQGQDISGRHASPPGLPPEGPAAHTMGACEVVAICQRELMTEVLFELRK